MVQLGGRVICDTPLFGRILLNVAIETTDMVRDLAKDFLDKQVDMFSKEYITGKGSGITLTNNEIKYTTKINISQKNRVILLKETTRITNKSRRKITHFS